MVGTVGFLSESMKGCFERIGIWGWNELPFISAIEKNGGPEPYGTGDRCPNYPYADARRAVTLSKRNIRLW